MKKHIPPLLQAVWPYLFMLLCFIPEEWVEALLCWISEVPFLIALMIANLFGYGQDFARIETTMEVIITVVGIVFWVCSFCVLLRAILYPLRTKSLTALELARWDLIIKLCHIPVYVFLFLFSLLILLAIAAPAVLMMALFGIPSIIVMELVMMLTSSCYGFRALRKARQEGLADKKWATIHTIAHCIFVLDVISAFLVWKRLKAATNPQ